MVYQGSSRDPRAHDELLHASTRPVLGIHAPDQHHEVDSLDGRLLSVLNTLPTGPPYGRLSSCPASPTFYNTKVGIVVDMGYASVVGGTLSAVNSEIASMITQTNVILRAAFTFSLPLLAIAPWKKRGNAGKMTQRRSVHVGLKKQKSHLEPIERATCNSGSTSSRSNRYSYRTGDASKDKPGRVVRPDRPGDQAKRKTSRDPAIKDIETKTLPTAHALPSFREEGVRPEALLPGAAYRV